MNKYQLKEEERKKMREAEVEASLQEGAKSGSKTKKDDESDSSSSDDEEEIDAEKAEMLDREGAMVGQQIDTGRVGMQVAGLLARVPAVAVCAWLASDE